MSRNYSSKIRSKLLNIKGTFRRIIFRVLGLKMGSNVILGKINCQWPHSISIGDKTVIEDDVYFKIHHPFSSENKIDIGSRVFIGHGCEFNCNTNITIGSDSMIASSTTIVDTGHELSLGININRQPCTVAAIVIEEDVWVGTQCVILQGVTIGKGSVIGAGSLVNKSVPPYQIWAGTPAKFIRNRS